MTVDFFGNVSRETKKSFMVFEELLKKWNKKINLVSSATTNDFRERHVLDSLQLIQFAKTEKGVWLDIGSGGGFPGIPLAIYSKEKHPEFKFNFMDSNSKKCLFLEEVCRKLNIEGNVICDRIEAAPIVSCDYVVSRALAPLDDLLGYSKRHRNFMGKSLFLKGKNFKEEILQAKSRWHFSYKIHQSLSHKDGKIVEIDHHKLLNEVEHD